MECIYKQTAYLQDAKRHYCPGCTHGIVHKIVGEALEELGLLDDVITVGPVGCSGLIHVSSTRDAVHSLHGRASAVATGIKAVLPDKIVYTNQGDGDLISIGCAETVHAAARGTNITVIGINNCIYGMTGGQMAATTLVEQKSTTSPGGRQVGRDGYPIRIAEMLSTLDGVAFAARGSLHNIKNINQAKKYIKAAFQCQKDKKGYSYVELLSTCPTNWHLDPVSSVKWIEDNMLPFYPIGIKKEVE